MNREAVQSGHEHTSFPVSSQGAPPVISRARWIRLIPILVIGASLAAGAILFLFDPAQNSFYPICPLYRMTGLLCPGCGSLRALHQLTHGHVIAAIKLNPLLMAGIAIGAWFAFRSIYYKVTGRILPAIFEGEKWLWFLLVATLAFGVLRNI